MRIFLVPILLVFLISPHGWYPLIAATIFLIAAFTDWLDGHLARSTNQITRLGQLLDPIADKLLVTAALVSLAGRQLVPAWMVVIILCRELAITGLRALAADQHIIIAADTFGKYKMVCFFIGALLLMLNLPQFHLPGLVTLGLGMLLSVISGIDYMRKYLTKIL
jgi:CDP-diacylglycerol--glycerol-3-phosphate 3-phosphatidyltransferase